MDASLSAPAPTETRPADRPPPAARLLPAVPDRPVRQTRAEATAATLVGLQAETTALHQRVAELERLVGALKGRLLARPPVR